jgi:hypothetical protein
MSYALVIVESPAKAKTIAGYLGKGYVVESSIGHIRDLPVRAADVPAAYKGEPWASLGIDVDNDFKPLYVISPRKKDQIQKLKKLLADADELFLATDEDREGEAIAWHLLEVLDPKVPVRRMVFHEITPGAIKRALQETREIDRQLVDAQEARRILDRLYGYEISPVLWRKITTGLSAGRVQSVATRIVVERERERMAFVAAGYWDLDLTLTTGDGTRSRSPRSSRSRTGDAPPRRSSRRPSSRRRAAGSGCRRRSPCTPPRACTRRATSPTCGPTARRSRTPHYGLRGRRSPSGSAGRSFPTRRVPTTRRFAAHRRPTRRSDRPVTASDTPTTWPPNSLPPKPASTR